MVRVLGFTDWPPFKVCHRAPLSASSSMCSSVIEFHLYSSSVLSSGGSLTPCLSIHFIASSRSNAQLVAFAEIPHNFFSIFEFTCLTEYTVAFPRTLPIDRLTKSAVVLCSWCRIRNALVPFLEQFETNTL